MSSTKDLYVYMFKSLLPHSLPSIMPSLVISFICGIEVIFVTLNDLLTSVFSLIYSERHVSGN